MKVEKMSLANIQGKLSRTEMKNVMAGSGVDNCQTYCIAAGDNSCSGGRCPKCVKEPNWVEPMCDFY